MMTRTLKMAAVATALAAVPMIGAAANQPAALNSCVKAFMADLSSKAPNKLKLLDTQYRDDLGTPDSNLRVVAGSDQLTLTARDAHDYHTVAQAICTVSSRGDVLELRTVPLDYQPF
jgi:hypothetical protein